MGRIMFLLVTAALYPLAVPLAAPPDTRGPQPPVFVNCPETLLVECGAPIQHQFLAVHPHSEKPFSKIRYRLANGPGSIDSLTGVWWCDITEIQSYAGASGITVSAEIRHGQKVLLSTRYVEIVATESAPSIGLSPNIQCGDTVRVEVGAQFTLAMTIYNSPACQANVLKLANVFVDRTLDGVCTYGPDSTQPGCDSCYLLHFEPSSADVGLPIVFDLVFSDGYDTVVCQLFVEAVNKPVETADYAVRIGQASQVSQGQLVTVPVYLDRVDPIVSPGSFDFLIAYDSTVLSLQGVTAGELITGCSWEYFTYQAVSDGCDGNCPTGLLRVLAIADLINGDSYSGCEPSGALPLELFSVAFTVSSGDSMDAQFVPLRFYWRECADNTIANGDGSLLLVSDTVYDPNGIPVVDGADALPGFGGISEVITTCVSETNLRLLPAVDFYNGGLDIAPPHTDSTRGDLSLNGVPYEAADLQMYANYFKAGLMALGTQTDLAQQASDINVNGTPLEMADFVSGQRVYAGLVSPDSIPSDTSVNLATFIHARFLKQVLLASTDTLAGVQFIFSGNLGAVGVARAGFTAEGVYDATANVTRVLVMTAIQESSGGVTYNPVINNGPLFSYTGQGTLTLTTAATRLGKPVRTAVQLSAPSVQAGQEDQSMGFDLGQNVPNPFNPATSISFSLPVASDITLEIFNIQGQKIGTVASGSYGAGEHTVVWDGSALASGLYLYRLGAGAFTSTKKMLLLK